MAELHHETILFSGRVQGVGFRYSVMQIAAEFVVSGYVINLGDGRVKLEVEGIAQEIQNFVVAIEERMHGFVRKTERTAGTRAPQFSGFTIK